MVKPANRKNVRQILELVDGCLSNDASADQRAQAVATVATYRASGAMHPSDVSHILKHVQESRTEGIVGEGDLTALFVELLQLPRGLVRRQKLTVRPTADRSSVQPLDHITHRFSMADPHMSFSVASRQEDLPSLLTALHAVFPDRLNPSRYTTLLRTLIARMSVSTDLIPLSDHDLPQALVMLSHGEAVGGLPGFDYYAAYAPSLTISAVFHDAVLWDELPKACATALLSAAALAAATPEECSHIVAASRDLLSGKNACVGVRALSILAQRSEGGFPTFPLPHGVGAHATSVLQRHGHDVDRFWERPSGLSVEPPHPLTTLEMASILLEAKRTKGAETIRSATQADAMHIGLAWVGKDALTYNDGSVYVSRDGSRIFRPPQAKRGLGRVMQANLELRPTYIDDATGIESDPERPWLSNVHIAMTDSPSIPFAARGKEAGARRSTEHGLEVE